MGEGHCIAVLIKKVRQQLIVPKSVLWNLAAGKICLPLCRSAVRHFYRLMCQLSSAVGQWSMVTRNATSNYIAGVVMLNLTWSMTEVRSLVYKRMDVQSPSSCLYPP